MQQRRLSSSALAVFAADRCVVVPPVAHHPDSAGYWGYVSKAEQDQVTAPVASAVPQHMEESLAKEGETGTGIATQGKPKEGAFWNP